MEFLSLQQQNWRKKRRAETKGESKEGKRREGKEGKEQLKGKENEKRTEKSRTVKENG